MTLEEYRRKRDFSRTTEPSPAGGIPSRGSTGSSARVFVVQKHAARQLHYDLRLEYEGVLMSWAVPKGPSLDTSEKRLAIRVEDHPLDYAAFEGVVPEGEYGAGSVMVWDTGTWSPQRSIGDDLAEGQLKFVLSGEKLRGKWALVRLKSGGESKSWLWIKEKDDDVRPSSEFNVVDAEPFSVLTGRSMDDISAAHDCSWTEQGQEGLLPPRLPGRRRGSYARMDLSLDSISGARRSGRPSRIVTLTSVEVAEPPAGEMWLHEIQVEGVRVRATIEPALVRLDTDKGVHLTHRVPDVARALAAIPVESAILEGVLTLDRPGEVRSAVACAVGLDSGQPAVGSRSRDLRLALFDVAYCSGFDLRRAGLVERKSVVRRMISEGDAVLRYVDHIVGGGDAVVTAAQSLGVRGIVSKRVQSAWRGGSRAWRRSRIAIEDHADGESAKFAAVSSELRDADPSVSIAGVHLTNSQRILFPEKGVSKRMLAQYFEEVASRMLPHIAGRPLSLFRCPKGVENECFFQKHPGQMPGDRLRSVPVARTDGEEESCITLSDLAGLLTLAQWNVIEIHPWGCRADNTKKPDRMIFDLDPGEGVTWDHLAEGARGIHFLLEDLGLRSFLKTSGGKGLHVVVPLLRRHHWEQVKEASESIAREIARCAPRHFTMSMSKSDRKGRVFIDCYRNVRGATCVAPYSPRARASAFVSSPLGWAELDSGPIAVGIFEQAARDREQGDPWVDFFSCRQGLTAAIRRRLDI